MREKIGFLITIMAVLALLWFHAVAAAAENPEVFIPLGHSNGVRLRDVSFSPDGRYVLTSSDDTTMKLWDAATGREIRTFPGGKEPIYHVAFSQEGRFVMSAGSGLGKSLIKLWDINTGKEIRTIEFKGFIAISPDGRYILIADSMFTDNKTLELWEVRTGKKIRTFMDRQNNMTTSIAFSPDGRNVLSFTNDYSKNPSELIKLWDVATGREISSFPVDTEIHSISVSPDGKYALLACKDEKVMLWDVNKGRVMRTFRDPPGRVEGMCWSPDSKSFLTATLYSLGNPDMKDYPFILRDANTGEIIRKFGGHEDGVGTVRISPDGRYVLSSGISSGIKMWELNSGKEIRSFVGLAASSIKDLKVSFNGLQAASAYYGPVTIIWELTTGKAIRRYKSAGVLSPGNKYIADRDSEIMDKDGQIKVWELATGREIISFAVKYDYEYPVTFSQNNNRLLTYGKEKLTGKYFQRILDVKSGKQINAIRCIEIDGPHGAFSPDGNFVLLPRNGTHPDETGATGRSLFLKEESMIKLMEVATGKELRTFLLPKNDFLSYAGTMVFSHDGTKAASAIRNQSTYSLMIWNVHTGDHIKTFSGHKNLIMSINFSQNDQQVVSTSLDGEIKLWDIASGQEIRTLSGHSGAINWGQFTLDGRQIVSGGNDDTIRIWDVSTGKELAMMIAFSDGEWITITPEGYFTASKNGPSKLSIRLDKHVYGVDQFYDVFYRPDIVEAQLRGEDTTTLASTNLEEALQNPPPSVDFDNVPAESSDKKVTIKYRITSTGGGIGEIRLFQNGKLIQSDGFYRQAKKETTKQTTLLAYNTRAIKDELRGITLAAKKDNKQSFIESTPKGDTYEGTITVDAISGENDISLAAFNKSNTVQSILKTATFKSTIKPEEPHLYVLAVGIDEYKSKGNNLAYAVKDADSITAKIKAQSLTQYKPENIHIALLKNSAATKTNIMGKLQELSQVIRPNDVFVLFIASHGVFQSGLYSIVTNDYDGNLDSNSLINSADIMEVSKTMKALTQIFILDTCHAGGLDNFVSGLYDTRMTVMARNMGLHMFASASSTQEALDGYKGKNGMFTYTLLEGLNNNRGADTNKDSKVSIYELGSYAKDQTVKLSKETGHTQTPMINNFGKDISVYVIK